MDIFCPETGLSHASFRLLQGQSFGMNFFLTLTYVTGDRHTVFDKSVSIFSTFHASEYVH